MEDFQTEGFDRSTKSVAAPLRCLSNFSCPCGSTVFHSVAAQAAKLTLNREAIDYTVPCKSRSR